MATRTIAEGFNLFHSRITPSNYEMGKAKSHKSSITNRLTEYYDLNQLFYSGSANNGTSISQHSDIDFFASIPTENLKKDSSLSLRHIKECLQGRYPSTKIYVDSPAVVLNFGSGGWMKSSPRIHTSYVTEENKRLNMKLKPLICFVKAWKYYNNVPISSFYLELRITKLMQSESSIVYDIDFNSVLQKLTDCNLASIQDPKGISGYVNACPSETLKSDALSKLRTAKARSEKARNASSNENIKDSFYWWDKVFSGKFPNYYY